MEQVFGGPGVGELRDSNNSPVWATRIGDRSVKGPTSDMHQWNEKSFQW